MKAAYEAVIHTAVVGPVFLLAGMIEATARVCRTATCVADRMTGEPVGHGLGQQAHRWHNLPR